MKRLIASCLVLCSSCAISAVMAAEEPPTTADTPIAETETLWQKISVSVGLGYKQSLWHPGFRGDVMDFQTEGLMNADIGALLTLRGFPVGFYNYEGPVNTGASQDELFVLNVEQDTAFKKLEVGVLLSWIPFLQNPDHWFLKAISRIHYIHTEETFFGDAKAIIPFAYVPSDMRIEERGDVVRFYGIEVIEPGESVAFRTRFKDDEVAVVWPMELFKIPFKLRAGYFASSWLRPSDLDRDWRLVDDDTLVLYETRFEAKGLVMGVAPPNRSAPGLQSAITGHWGLNNKISNRVNRDYNVKPDEDLLYAAGKIECWYNWAFQNKRWGTLTATVGGAINRRIFATEIHPLRGTWESEDLYRIFAQLRVAL